MLRRALTHLGLTSPPAGQARPASARVLRPGEDSSPAQAVVARGLGVVVGVAAIVEAFEASWPWVPLLLVVLGGFAVPTSLRAKRRLDADGEEGA